MIRSKVSCFLAMPETTLKIMLGTLGAFLSVDRKQREDKRARDKRLAHQQHFPSVTYFLQVGLLPKVHTAF